jgi:hypothetical protein
MRGCCFRQPGLNVHREDCEDVGQRIVDLLSGTLAMQRLPFHFVMVSFEWL